MHAHHHHDQTSSRIGWAFLLNVSFTIIEFIGGFLTNSTAIMADAVHDLGDSLSIGLAWLLSKTSHKQSNANFTYGYQRFSLLGALINSFVLVAGSIWVLSEAIPKLQNPQMPVVEGMLGLALLGVVENGLAAFKLSRGKTLNEKVLNWHLLEDVLGWCAVLIVSIVLLFVEWPILDPLLSIAFTAFILFNVIKNLGTTVRLFLQAAPEKTLSDDIQRTLNEIDDVQEMHHLHLWSLDGEHHVLTVHLVLKQAMDSTQLITFKQDIALILKPFALSHTTVEIEFVDEPCRDA